MFFATSFNEEAWDRHEMISRSSKVGDLRDFDR